jgi:cation/acetate symporter
MNLVAVGLFIPTVLLTLYITWRAARVARGKADYYSAGARITGVQNGVAIAGDMLSASTFLGLTGMFYIGGADLSAIYYVTPPMALCLLLVLIAAPLRRAGRYTLGDVLTSRTSDPDEARRLRALSGVSTIVVSLMFLVAQLIGAGSLISVLFGVSFPVAVVVITVLMTVYVGFGGMLAATWVQIIKAAMLVAVVIVLTGVCLVVGGGPRAIYERAAEVHPLGWGLFRPGSSSTDLFSALSLGISTTVGSLGLPHLLIRFFTVPDEKAAQVSAAVSTTIMGVVIMLLFGVVAPASVAFLTGAGQYLGPDGALRGGVNMTAIHLADAVGGPVLMGVVSAVAFATILAVVAGVVMASASAASHDLYAVLARRAERDERSELRAFRVATVLIGLMGLGLAFVFQHENVSFMIGLAMAIALSANVPGLMLTLYWKGLTPTGSLVGGVVGLVGSVVLLVLGPSIWVKVLGHAAPIFPSDYPALLVAPIGLATSVIVSRMTARRAAAGRPAPAGGGFDG